VAFLGTHIAAWRRSRTWRGEVEHRDSLKNIGVIRAGDVQWMAAGNGIIHQEMPKGDGSGAMYGFQLWANLPAASKMMEPRYREVKATDIPTITAPAAPGSRSSRARSMESAALCATS